MMFQSNYSAGKDSKTGEETTGLEIIQSSPLDVEIISEELLRQLSYAIAPKAPKG